MKTKKKFVWVFAIAILIVSCTNNSSGSRNGQNKKVNNLNSNGSETVRSVSKRDYSINKENAYNDLFLDSAALDTFITRNNIPDSLAGMMRNFYNTRNYEFSWFSSNGLSEEAFGFWSRNNYDNDTSNYLKKVKIKMNALMSNDSLIVNSEDGSIVNTELMLTRALLSSNRNNQEQGIVNRNELALSIPYKKQDAGNLSDSLLNKADSYFSNFSQPYKDLLVQLRKYNSIEKSGGWPSIPESIKKIRKGKKSTDVTALKKFLSITRDFTQHDSSAVYNDSIIKAVKNFQSRFGLPANGIITTATLQAMNAPVAKIIRQILINLNRMKWLPQKPKGQEILVNIPEFKLAVYDGTNKVFDMPVVVGKSGENTTTFSDRLTTIVFSPYWDVPESIIRKEIIPAMAKNKNYLKKNDMEITGQLDGLPVIKQKPGDKNALGKVKFLFPNSFNIYFHDTPAKSLFNNNIRAFSHGCIRLKDPEKLADYLLINNPDWTPEKIREAMNSHKERSVNVKNPVPVFITYYTAWVDDNGQLNFRNDIYGKDKDVADKMFNK